jgi:hypothetical protein
MIISTQSAISHEIYTFGTILSNLTSKNHFQKGQKESSKPSEPGDRQIKLALVTKQMYSIIEQG